MEHNSVEYLHALVEAMRLAFAGTSLQFFVRRPPLIYNFWIDSEYYVTDPDVAHVPVEELLSKVGT